MTADLDPILRRLADHERIEALAITLREQVEVILHAECRDEHNGKNYQEAAAECIKEPHRS